MGICREFIRLMPVAGMAVLAACSEKKLPYRSARSDCASDAAALKADRPIRGGDVKSVNA
jgi:hypothetical protein